MKTAFAFLFAGIILLIFLYSKGAIFFTGSTIDIHLHDTYYIIAYFHLIVLVVLFLGTLFAIGGILGTLLRNKYFIWMTFIFFLVDVFFIVQVIRHLQ